jgi:hypothetical protein
MFNETIQKVTVPKKDIQSVSKDGEYYVRYRVVTSDKRKVSHWSPVFVLSGGSLYSTLNSVNVSVSASAVSVNWNVINTLNISQFDVYVAYGSGSGTVTFTSPTGFQYYGTVSANNIYIPKPTPTKTQMKVAIFARGNSQLDNSILKSIPPTAPPDTLVGSSASFLAETGIFLI